MIFCGQHDIALRGHRDDSKYYDSTSNVGNFQGLLNFRVECGDVILEEHFQTCPKNATYLSKTVQNELIEICGDYLRKQIIREVKVAKFFSILADEVADVSNKEQMPLVLRFVDTTGHIREEFIKFIYLANGTTGENIAEAIKSEISVLGLDMRNCRGQGYDGAGNMSGKYSGTAIRIQNDFPDAVYVHCASHRLNLCMANGCPIQSIENTFGTMKVVHDFFNWPKRLSLLEGKISAVYNQVSRHQLIDVCRTRWIARIDALEVFESLYRAIILALEEVKDNKGSSWNRESCVDASGLFYQCISFEFIMSLVVARRGLSLCSTCHNKMNIVKAYSEIASLKNVVMEKRRKIDETHRHWYEQAVNLAKSVGTSPLTPRICSNQTMRANPPSQSTEEYYRITVSSPLLDHLISQLDLRFSPDKIEIMKKGFLLVPFYMTGIIQASDDVELWKK